MREHYDFGEMKGRKNPYIKYLKQPITIRLELIEGVPIFRASHRVQARIQALLDKQSESKLTESESQELDLYEEVDDYLSFVNRTVRNSIVAQQAQKV